MFLNDLCIVILFRRHSGEDLKCKRGLITIPAPIQDVVEAFENCRSSWEGNTIWKVVEQINDNTSIRYSQYHMDKIGDLPFLFFWNCGTAVPKEKEWKISDLSMTLRIHKAPPSLFFLKGHDFVQLRTAKWMPGTNL